jgi:hypothetical protein
VERSGAWNEWIFSSNARLIRESNMGGSERRFWLLDRWFIGKSTNGQWFWRLHD